MLASSAGASMLPDDPLPANSNQGQHRRPVTGHVSDNLQLAEQAASQQQQRRRNNIAPDIEAASEDSSSQDPAAQNRAPWALNAAAAGQEMRLRLDQASDHLGNSLRQLYVSASTMANEVPPAYHNIPGIVPYYHGRSSGPPPSYDDVINPYAAPPTYQSLFGQMRRARKNSRGPVDLLTRLAFILLSTIGCTILLAFMILIPFTMIIVGAIYIDECRIEHIPAYLLFGGLIWASKSVFHCYRQFRLAAHVARSNRLSELELERASRIEPMSISSQLSRDLSDSQRQQPEVQSNPRDDARVASKSFYCELVLNFSLVGWFIAGCVIVLRNNQPDFYNVSSPKYCNKTVYMYTFWIIATAILLSCLFIGCFCCLMVSSVLAGRHQEPPASSRSTSELGEPVGFSRQNAHRAH